jgi:hypothetical protein
MLRKGDRVEMTKKAKKLFPRLNTTAVVAKTPTLREMKLRRLKLLIDGHKSFTYWHKRFWKRSLEIVKDLAA